MEDIVIRNLCKSFAGKPVLRDFSAVLPVGQVTGLMAPSGAGKTTLARCLCGLMKEKDGAILWDGKPIRRKDRKRKGFLIMQDVNLQLFADSVLAEAQLGNDANEMEAMAALERMRVSRNFSITLAVTLRFLPALRQDFRHIRDAMALRRIRGLEKKLECVYVPMLMGAAQTAEELSESATSRGIEHPGKRSSWRLIGFHIQDVAVALLFLALCVGGICCKGVLP